jgi:hypothetical protein
MTEDTKSTSLDSNASTSASTPDDLAAMKAELEANLKVAVDDTVKAGFEAQTACHRLRDLEWLSTAVGHDAETWGDIAEAVGALPADATVQQIALAQAKAIVASKQRIQSQVMEQLPAVREKVVVAAKAYDEKEQTVDKAKEALLDLNPTRKYLKHTAPSILSGAWIMGMFNKSFKG